MFGSYDMAIDTALTKNRIAFFRAKYMLIFTASPERTIFSMLSCQ